eukprot:COSAG05_NODE_466_length_9533_cov_5.547806_11_plen_59_part_00
MDAPGHRRCIRHAKRPERRERLGCADGRDVAEEPGVRERARCLKSWMHSVKSRLASLR